MTSPHEYTRCIMEAALEAFLPGKDFPSGRSGARHLLKVDLVWPRPGIARRAAAWPVTIRGGQAVLTGGDVRERLLFKEIVEGPVGIEAHCTAPLGSAEAARLLGSLAGALSDLAVRPAAAPSSIPFQYAGKLLAGADKIEVRLYGSGCTRITVPQFGMNREWKPLRLALRAAEAIYSADAGGTRRGTAARRRLLLPAAAEVGTLVLALRFIGR